MELPQSEKGKDLYGTILWNRAGKDMAPIGMMSPDGAGPGGDNRGSGGEDGGGASAVAKHVSPSSISERTCIQKFGISYHEIITKLVMEQGVLSEAESRMVLLLLSEPSDETALPETQMRMLRAVVDIEMRGISRPTIAFFRSELAAVASEVLGVQRVVRYKEESLEDVLEAEFSGKVNVAYEGVGGPLLGAVCKQLAPGGQVLIVGSISQYPHNTHNAQKQKEKESNNVAEAEAEAASSVPAHGIPGLEDLDIMADVFRPRKTLDLPSGEGRQLIGNVWGDSFTSGVLPTITENIYADHAGGTLAALVDENHLVSAREAEELDGRCSSRERVGCGIDAREQKRA